MSLDLLAFGAHPDDVELSCGGWLALAASRGQRVGVVDLTRGELATNGSPEVRAREAAAAAEVLGLCHRQSLGLPDGGLSAADPVQIDAVVATIRELQPALALVPATEARHPDHEAAGALLRRAAFLAGLVRHRPELGAPFRPQRLIVYPQRHEVVPDFVVDTHAAIEAKIEAIACYESQFGAGVATLLNQPLGVGSFLARDRYWGATIGVSHGEPYQLGGPVPLSDPVAHFAAHPAPPLLVPPR